MSVNASIVDIYGKYMSQDKMPSDTTTLDQKDEDSNKGKGGKKTVLNLSEGELVKMVTLRFGGMTTSNIAKELGISRQSVDNYLKKDKAQALTKELQESAIGDAKLYAKNALAKLTDKAIKALEVALDEGDMAAVRLHFTALGLLDEEPQQTQQANLQIVLPGGIKPEGMKDVISE
jgi:predicted transcriptional regulator